MDSPSRRRGRPRQSNIEPGQGTVQSLDRAIQLMQALAKDGPANLTELALRIGMPPSSAHRLLNTLETYALVEFETATQDWLIGVEAFRIGSAFKARGNLVQRAHDIMQGLVDETGETANLAQAHEGDIVVLAQADTSNPIRAFFPAGARVPMHSSGIGKALLAYLQRSEVEQILRRRGLPAFTPATITSAEKLFDQLRTIRTRGWSLDDEERYGGMRCIAAPIFNEQAQAIAGISVSGPAARFEEAAITEIAAKVKRAAAELTAKIGGISA